MSGKLDFLRTVAHEPRRAGAHPKGDENGVAVWDCHCERPAGPLGNLNRTPEIATARCEDLAMTRGTSEPRFVPLCLCAFVPIFRTGIVFFCSVIIGVSNAAQAFLGDADSGNLADAVHVIALRDEEGGNISPGDEPVLPFSTRQTCGICHDYATISDGWHFGGGKDRAGRPGQPWIYADAAAGVQIPLSYRGWPGTFTPEQAGLSQWEFAKIFAGRTAGGIEDDANRLEPDLMARWLESGQLEANCMACHDVAASHDQAEYADQVARENFRWAAAATCGFASVSGSAKDMPEMYDYMMPAELNDPKLRPPAVMYAPNSFNHDDKVFLDIKRRVPSQRCFFCHSERFVGETHRPQWKNDVDVHLSAGLACVDCHRHGLNHKIIRGYAGESDVTGNPLADDFSCAGCHLGQPPQGGRLGAPPPEHEGIPVVHFDKLACTACHSGPWPSDSTARTQSSTSHGLGLYGKHASEGDLPHISAPVYATGADGKIAPHRLLWPAYWGVLAEDKVTPVAIETVNKVVTTFAGEDHQPKDGWFKFNRNRLAAVLEALAGEALEGQAVYICGGRLYRMDGDSVVTSEHKAARPYMWPMAHDVRPAAQSLGVKSCGDCHASDGAFFFGDVAVDSPLENDLSRSIPMTVFQHSNALFARLFAISFVFRPYLKVTLAVTSVFLAGLLAAYGLCGLRRLSGLARGLAPALTAPAAAVPKFVALAVFAACVIALACGLVLAWTGFYATISGKALSSWPLMIHVTLGGVFAVCAAGAVFLTADRHRAGGAGFAARLLFWLAAAALLAVMLSVLLSMFRLFGTGGQEVLLNVHRWTAVVLTVCIVLYLPAGKR